MGLNQGVPGVERGGGGQVVGEAGRRQVRRGNEAGDA